MTDVLRQAAETRTLVGYLAEQHGAWFPSQFFGPSASAFLSPVFARTVFQAQCNGVAAAAARLHDDGIGVGRTHHLFRLPEVLEQGVATTLTDATFVQRIRQHLDSPAVALVRLQTVSAPGAATEGALPLVGDFAEAAGALLQAIAGLYLDAFRKGIKTFPFVREV